jgi:hypothetical protein
MNKTRIQGLKTTEKMSVISKIYRVFSLGVFQQSTSRIQFKPARQANQPELGTVQPQLVVIIII